jgi:hypothetical protein
MAAYIFGRAPPSSGQGPLQDAGISLSIVFAMSAAAAAVMGRCRR